jgi:hydroxyacylglutathione hydrolase
MNQFVRITFPVPPLSCNCSIIGDQETKQAIVVDPGGNHERILKEVADMGFTVTAILHTHAHFDHFLASGHIKEATGASLFLHPQDQDLWGMLEIQCRMFNVSCVSVPPPDQWINDESEVRVGPYTGTVIHTPGHTPGSVCFFFESQNLVLSGDTLFRGGIGRTDLWGGDGQVIERSIRERLYTLDESTLVIPGHGRESSIGWERENNKFVHG